MEIWPDAIDTMEHIHSIYIKIHSNRDKSILIIPNEIDYTVRFEFVISTDFHEGNLAK